MSAIDISCFPPLPASTSSTSRCQGMDPLAIGSGSPDRVIHRAAASTSTALGLSATMFASADSPGSTSIASLQASVAALLAMVLLILATGCTYIGRRNTHHGKNHISNILASENFIKAA